ncbi:MAG: hypothetical protein J3K34DRAFT_416130 [Monoraphidium minutum]|nr:MAG: hypothetical protein J3K34DRAFT_416130 [Monoraphidium minutum]
MDGVLSVLEKRAAEAESRMAALEQRLVAGASGGVSGAAAADLHELRALLVAAKEEQDALRRERDEALKAASKAGEEALKAEYRAKHLARALCEADAALAAAKAS